MPSKVAAFSDALLITSSDSHICTLTNDGSAWCWGNNNTNQITSQEIQFYNKPEKLNYQGRRFHNLTVNDYSTCLLDSLSVECVGGDWDNFSIETPASFEKIVLSTTPPLLLGITPTGQVYSTKPAEGKWTTIDISEHAIIDIKSSHSGNSSYLCALDSIGQIFCTGIDIPNHSTNSNQWFTSQPIFIKTNTDYRFDRIWLGTHHVCARQKHLESTVCWGLNSFGNFGSGTTTTYEELSLVGWSVSSTDEVSNSDAQTCLYSSGVVSCVGHTFTHFDNHHDTDIDYRPYESQISTNFIDVPLP